MVFDFQIDKNKINGKFQSIDSNENFYLFGMSGDDHSDQIKMNYSHAKDNIFIVPFIH